MGTDYVTRRQQETKAAVYRMSCDQDALMACDRYSAEDLGSDWVYGRDVGDFDAGTKAILRANAACHPLCRTCPNELLCSLDPSKVCRVILKAEYDEYDSSLTAWIKCGVYAEDWRTPDESQHTWGDLARELYALMTKRRQRAQRRIDP